MGLRPGDQTAGPLPEACSLSDGGGGRILIDLRRISEADLQELCQASAADPLGALLPEPPGVVAEHLAHFTGVRTCCTSLTGAGD